LITRENILSHLVEGLQKHPEIIAMWLEGSDGTGSTDDYSDIDIVINVEDGFESAALSLCEERLNELSLLDLSYEELRHNPKKRYKVFHLKNTPEPLFLDINVQSQSLNTQFVKQNDSEVPIVIFDKKSVIQFIDINETELNLYLKNRLYHLENTINQKARVEKYVIRNKFIEAMGYYHKFVVTPLIEILRIKYKPINHDYYIVCISKHLPKEVTLELEELYKVNSINDISIHVERAYAWFYKVLNEVKMKI
jgi:hypothetical protein